jgi:hypothetical protein
MKNYSIETKIGNGKFGEVYKGTNNINKNEVAIKIEKVMFSSDFEVVEKQRNLVSCEDKTEIKTKLRSEKICLLKYEATIINYLGLNNCKYIPRIYWYGKIDISDIWKIDGRSQNDSRIKNLTSETNGNSEYMCLIESYFDGGSLFENMLKINEKNKMETSKNNDFINKIMEKMITIIRNVHEKGVIHRDIKPHNFMFSGSWKNHQECNKGDLFLIDFGLAQFVEDSEYKRHDLSEQTEENQKSTNILGTPNYISYFIHEGFSPSKRDDLISVGYIYLFLLWRTLPWLNIDIKEEEFNISAERSVNKLSSRVHHSYNALGELPCMNKKSDRTDIHHPMNEKIKNMKKWNILRESIYDYVLRTSSDFPPIYRYLDYCYHLEPKYQINYDGLIK